jgi:hypothetical protein
VQSEAELAGDYLRMIGADPRPELGQYEGTPIPGVRRKAIPPADLDEQFKRGRTASVHMKQRRQAKKSSHRKNNPYMVTTGGQAVPADPRQRSRDQSVSEFIDYGTPMSLAGGGHRVPRKVQGLEERGTRYRIVQGSDGRFHIVDAATGTPTGKYGMTAENAQKVLEKFIGRSNPHRDLAEFERRLQEMRARGEVYEPQPLISQTAERPKAATGPMGLYRSPDGRRVKTMTEKQAASPVFRGWLKVANNPRSSRSGPSLDRAAEAVIAELSKQIKRRKVRRNPSPGPGISVEEVIADVQGAEWANWAYNRAGIMHWR